MRLGTAATRRTMDRWRERANSEVERFLASVASSAVLLFSTPKRERALLFFPLFFTSSVNFVALELIVLILIGFFTAKLHCYRLVNSVLRLVPSAR